MRMTASANLWRLLHSFDVQENSFAQFGIPPTVGSSFSCVRPCSRKRRWTLQFRWNSRLETELAFESGWLEYVEESRRETLDAETVVDVVVHVAAVDGAA